MKYLEKVRDNLREVLTEFIENEPEDTEEYSKILDTYNEIRFYIADKKWEKLK